MRTFRYILSLLAATLALLAQPAMAQAPETSTKAQPSDPVFPSSNPPRERRWT
jgi:hypothetical protein